MDKLEQNSLRTVRDKGYQGQTNTEFTVTRFFYRVPCLDAHQSIKKAPLPIEERKI